MKLINLGRSKAAPLLCHPWEELEPLLPMAEAKAAVIELFKDDKACHDDLVKEALQMTLATTVNFLPLDLSMFHIRGVETPFTFPYVRGIRDLDLEIKPNVPGWEEFAGRIAVADWKSTAQVLNAEWAAKYLMSWQGLIYGSRNVLLPEGEGPEAASHIIFRGVSRPLLSTTINFRQDVMELGPGTSAEVYREMSMLGALRESLRETIPPNMPWSKARSMDVCKKYRTECPHLKNCHNGVTQVGTPPFKILSFSSAATFRACQERHRLDSLNGSDGSMEQTESTYVGSMLHRGLEVIYRAAMDLQKRGVV